MKQKYTSTSVHVSPWYDSQQSHRASCMIYNTSALSKLPVIRYFTGFSKNHWSIFLNISNLLRTLHLWVQFYYDASTLAKLAVFRCFTGILKISGKFDFGFGIYVESYVYPEICNKIIPTKKLSVGPALGQYGKYLDRKPLFCYFLLHYIQCRLLIRPYFWLFIRPFFLKF